MMNNLSLNSWIVKLVIVAALILLVATIFRLLTPQSPVLPAPSLLTQNSDGTVSNFKNITYTGPALETPAKIAILQALKNPALTQNAAASMAANLNLSQNPKLKNVWQNADYLLIIDKDLNQATLTSLKQLPDESSPIDKNSAINTAQTFTTQYLPNLSLQPVSDRLDYLQNSEEFTSVSDPSKASLLKVPFTYLINGVPVFYNYESDYPLVVIVDSRGQVIRASLSSNLGQVTEIPDQVPLLTLTDALKQLNTASQGSVIATIYGGVQTIDLRTIQSGVMTQAQLEYRVDPKLQLAYPYYRLSGKIIDRQNLTMNAEIIIPAAKTAGR